MEELIIKAMPRSEKLNIVRKMGCIPGVLNGPGTASVSVKFEVLTLTKIITKHGTNAKMWIELESEKKFGYIKEIQRDAVDGKILHVAIQLVETDKEVKILLPINYHGAVELEHKLLQLQIYKSEIEVLGKVTLMPDEAVVDVSKKESGENVTAVDFNLPSGIKILTSENEIYAIIRNVKSEKVEVPEEVKPVEESKNK